MPIKTKKLKINDAEKEVFKAYQHLKKAEKILEHYGIGNKSLEIALNKCTDWVLYE